MPETNNKNLTQKKTICFSFGDPESVMDDGINEYLGSYLTHNGEYYQTPVPFMGLARLLDANAYHGTMLEFKGNMFLRAFKPSPAISRQTIRKVITDYLVFANAYLQKFYNSFGEVVLLKHLPALNMRQTKDKNIFCQLTNSGKIIKFHPGEVLHYKNYDVRQDIYGKPSYFGAIQSMLLQEDATLFRRKYYRNGAHMGYVFYSTSATLDPADEEALRKAISESKGAGNFKNLFLHIPDGKEKDVQILPVGDFSTRDELATIKSISRDDIIAAHRIPPALANIIPSVQGGFGDIEKADKVFMRNEIIPLRKDFNEINNLLRPDLQVDFGVKDESEDL